VKSCPDIARAEAHLAAGPWDALVAGPSLMHRTGLRRLGSLHQRYPWVSVVLALHERPRADLAEIVRAGAEDLVPLHADDGELARALARATRMTRARLRLVAEGPGARDRGRTVMVASPSGGCGKTFLATNAADFLARTTGQDVVLVDLDLQFGEVSTALRLKPDVTITDALTAEAEGHDLDEILDAYLLPHSDGFKVLAAPRLPSEADSVTPGDVTRILDALRARGAWVVIDSHEGLSDLSVAALEAANHVFVLSTPDRPSLVNVGRYLASLERLGVAPADISVVLNKAEPDTGLDPVDMAVQLGRRFEAMIPYNRDVPRSLNVGVPLIAGKPRSPISASLASALSTVLPRTPKAEPVPAVPPVPTATAPALPVAPPPPPVAGPAALVSSPPVPRPAAEEPPAEPLLAEDDAPVDAPAEVDLTTPERRTCAPTVRARPAGRCRRSVPRPEVSPRRGRSPPPLGRAGRPANDMARVVPGTSPATSGK